MTTEISLLGSDLYNEKMLIENIANQAYKDTKRKEFGKIHGYESKGRCSILPELLQTISFSHVAVEQKPSFFEFEQITEEFNCCSAATISCLVIFS